MQRGGSAAAFACGKHKFSKKLTGTRGIGYLAVQHVRTPALNSRESCCVLFYGMLLSLGTSDQIVIVFSLTEDIGLWFTHIIILIRDRANVPLPCLPLRFRRRASPAISLGDTRILRYAIAQATRPGGDGRTDCRRYFFGAAVVESLKSTSAPFQPLALLPGLGLRDFVHACTRM